MTAALSAASEVSDTLMVIDAVLTTSRCASSTGRGPCSGGAGASGAPATPSLKLDAALSGRDGPAQAVKTPNVAMLVTLALIVAFPQISMWLVGVSQAK